MTLRAGRVLATVGGVIGVGVYFVVEAVIRSCNFGRRRSLEQDELALLARLPGSAPQPWSNPLADVPLDKVRVVAPARLPVPHLGITLGRAVYLRHPLDLTRPEDQLLLLHELVHVGQRERAGRLGMAFRYGRGFCEVMSYRRHPMETEARHVARDVQHFLTNPVE